MKKKIVLAYSGGLDTSCILKWLQLKDYEVLCYIADVGQDDDFDEVKRRAFATGAKTVEIYDLKDEFVTDYIFPAVAGAAVYEGRYLLGTALARPVIAKGQVDMARKYGATILSHGATGKGNDQVRFELGYAALAPHMDVFAPWKDKEFLNSFQGRVDLINFAKKHEIDIPVTLEKPFSTDENVMHRSYESGALEDPNAAPDESIFTVCKNLSDAPDTAVKIAVTYKNARPTRFEILDGPHKGEVATEPLALLTLANSIAGEHAVGRVDIVENRFVGIKSRGVYETPGGTVLHAALRDLEGIAMDKSVRRLRDILAPEYAALIYNGFWFSPEMEFLSAALEKSQDLIDGVVTCSLYKGNITILGRRSPSSLYNQNLSSMDIAGGYDQADAEGFIRINSLRLKAHRVIVKESATHSDKI